MTRKRVWYKCFPSDFLNGTRGLTLEENGAYRTIVDLIYDRGGPLPDDERWVASHMNVSTRKYRSLRDNLIDKEKIRLIDGFITNDRCDRELGLAQAEHDARVEAGRKGGETRAENLSVEIDGKQVQSEFGVFSDPELGAKLSGERTEKVSKNKEPPQAKTKPGSSILDARGYIEEENKKKNDKKEKEKITGVQNRGTRIPADWTPDKNGVAYARERDYSNFQIMSLVDDFKDYWLAKAGATAVKKDWNAAWRTWIRNDIKFKNRKPTKGQIAG